MMANGFTTIVRRDLRLAARRRIDALLPVAFFIVAASLFPLGVGPEAQVLRQIGPGIVWVCALLATMLSLGSLFAGDQPTARSSRCCCRAIRPFSSLPPRRSRTGC
jgi:heme exporter protein B